MPIKDYDLSFLDTLDEKPQKDYDLSFLDDLEKKDEADKLESIHKQKEIQKQQAQTAAVVQQQQAQAQAADPKNWSAEQTKKHFKENPPRNMEEAIKAKALVKQKEEKEKQAVDFLLHPEESISVLTKEKKERSRLPTPQEEKQLQRQKDIDLIKKYPTDLYSGVPAWMDSFAQGILPIRPEEMKRPGVEEASPVAKIAGKLVGLTGASFATAGIAPAVSKSLADFSPIAPSLFRMIPQAIQRASLWGGKEFIDQAMRVMSGEKPDPKSRIGRILSESGFGAFSGGISGIAKTIPRVIAQGVGRGAWIAGERLLQDHKIDKKDLFDISLNMALGSAVEAINAPAVSKAYQRADMTGFLRNKAIVRVMRVHPEYTRAQAEEAIALINDFALGLKPAAQVEILSKMPANITKMPSDQQAQFAAKLVESIKGGMNVEGAMKEAAKYATTEILKEAGKGVIKGLSEAITSLKEKAREYPSASDFEIAFLNMHIIPDEKQIAKLHEIINDQYGDLSKFYQNAKEEGTKEMPKEITAEVAKEGITVYRGSEYEESGNWFSESKEFAQQYGKAKEYSLPKNLNLLDATSEEGNKIANDFLGEEETADSFATDIWYQPPKEFGKYLKSKGYDGFRNEDNIFIVDKTKILPLREATKEIAPKENITTQFNNEITIAAKQTMRPGETLEESTARTKDWISSTLENDETSTDEELIDYFQKEGGFSKEIAELIVSKRNAVLSLPFGVKKEMKEEPSAETYSTKLGYKVELPVANAVEAVAEQAPISSGFHEQFSKEFNGIEPSWAIVFQWPIDKKILDAAEEAGLKINKRPLKGRPKGYGLTDIYLPGVAQNEAEKATEAFNKFAEEITQSSQKEAVKEVVREKPKHIKEIAKKITEKKYEYKPIQPKDFDLRNREGEIWQLSKTMKLSPQDIWGLMNPQITKNINKIKKRIFDETGLHLTITSALRTTEYNKAIEEAGYPVDEDSTHLYGDATDVIFRDKQGNNLSWIDLPEELKGDYGQTISDDDKEIIAGILKEYKKDFRFEEYETENLPHIHIEARKGQLDKIEDVIQEGLTEKQTIGALFPETKPKKEVVPLPTEEGEAGIQALSAKKWRVEMPKEALTKERINKTQIVQWVEKTFKVPIRGKATRRMNTHSGHYEVKAELIRMRVWGELEPITHEVAHHIDKKMKKSLGEYWRREFVPKGKKQAALKELADLDYDQAQRRTSEGFAEYMRYYLTTDEAANKAPIFHKFFTEVFLEQNPDFANKIAQLKKKMDIWYQQGAENRVLQQTDFAGEHTKDPRLMTKFEKAWNWIMKNFHDELYIIKNIEDQLGLEIGKNMKPSESPFALATYAKSKAGGIARTMVEEKMIDEHGNVLGPGLKEILDPIKYKEMQSFLAYAIAKRANLIQQRGKQSGLDTRDIKYIIDKYNNPKWDDVINQITDWSNHLIGWIVNAGGLGEEEAKLIRELNPIYLPFKRAFIDTIKITRGAGGFVNRGESIKRLKGSGRAILNPIEALVAQATELVSKAQKIRVAKAVADLAVKEGVGGFIVEVPAPTKTTTIGIEKLKAQLKTLVARAGITKKISVPMEGGGTQEVEQPLWHANWVDLGDLELMDLNDVLTVFTQDWQYNGKDNIVSIWKNGKRRFYELHPDFYRALMGIDMLKRGPILKILGPVARMLRLGATALKVSFGIARNPFRDAMTYAFASKRATATIFDPIKGVYRDITTKPGEVAWRYKAAGGAFAGQIGLDRGSTMAVYDDMLNSKLSLAGKTLKVAKHPVKALSDLVNLTRDILSITEMGPRVVEVEEQYKIYKKQNPEWSEEDCFIQAFNDAQDITVNFTKSGHYAKRINEATAFFNAAIRGPEKVFRTIRERPVMAIMKGLFWISSLAIWNWFKNHKKDWYKNLPPSYKYNNFFFEMGDVIVRLPIPFDLGIVFASIPLAMMDILETKDPRYLQGLQQLASAQIPDPTPTMFQPLIDVGKNKDFLGRPIESAGMQFLYPTERKYKYTSDLAAVLSKGFNTLGIELSPIQIDYLLNSYTGGFIKQLPHKNILEPADMPVLGDLLLRLPERPQRQLNNFFSDWERVSQRKQSGIATDEEIRIYNRIKPLYNTLTRNYFKNIRTLREEEDINKMKATYQQMGKVLAQYGYE